MLTRRIMMAGLLVLAPAAFAQDAELTVDQIIQKHFDAMGGVEKLKAVQSMRMSGNAVLMGGQMEAPLVMLMKRPSSMRMAMSIQGKELLQAYDGKTAWSLVPFQSPDPRAASADEAESLAENADMDGPLMDYKSKGNKVELLGKEDVEGTPSYKLKVTKKGDKVDTMYLDASTMLPIKTVVKRKMMGNEMEVEVLPGNYKKVEGMMMAHSIEQKVGGRSFMRMTMDKIEVNVAIDDSVFKMPEPPKVEEKKQ